MTFKGTESVHVCVSVSTCLGLTFPSLTLRNVLSPRHVERKKLVLMSTNCRKGQILK